MGMGAKLGVTAAVAAAVFAVDLMVPGGYAVGALYVVPLVLVHVLRCSAGWCMPTVALVSSALLLLDPVLGTSGTDQQLTYVNRGFSLLALWSVAGLVEVSRRRTLQVSEAQATAGTLFDAALEAAPDAMLVVDQGAKVRAANASALALFRYSREQLLGKALAELVVERRVEVGGLASVMGAPQGTPRAGNGGGLGGPLVGVRGDKSEVAVEATTSFLERDGERFTVHALRDITDKRRLEERLLSSQRMESIGRLAGGVAHDFNNLLAVIMSYGRFVADALDAEHPARGDVDEVLAAAERAAGLTRQLLAFSRRQVVKPLRLRSSTLVSDMEKMLRRLLGSDIELMTSCSTEEGLIEIDPAQLEQVILNLVINARDAMPKGGRITVEIGNATLDQAYCDSHPDVLAGEYVMLAVSDTGVGMTEAVRLRVFEPFFTTKAPGAGTGLGLATVYGIVKQANGHIWVYSEPGRGSTFKAYFPRVGGAPDALVATRHAPAQGGSETILLVEDEAPLRRVAVRVLKRAGYNVLEAGNGLDALAKVETGVKVDLLITDVVMPMMGGRELVAKLRERDPDLAVLYVSGYTENAIVHHGVLDPDIIFLQKPFQPDELLRHARLVLDGSGRNRKAPG
ncbi:MAG: response regulator [Deltaproteobacteria bacterium]|nr:response regulator [Deltaproteobacteria bacterium]